jgi:ABC-type multidrug transport system fused ATPase/permease subunit
VRRWRSLVAYAPQSAVLFEGSLRDNLLLLRGSDPAVPPQRLEDWLEQLEEAKQPTCNIENPEDCEACGS